jgi:predicted MFS family arabinose efflux permease
VSPSAATQELPEQATPSRARYGKVLGSREFRTIFVADIVSMLGNVVAAVALTVLIYERTGSPALAASVMALAFLPYLLGGVLLGAAPDRWPARRVLVCCDLLSAVIVAAMVLPGVPVVALLALLFANGLISPVYQGVRSSVLPQVLSPGPDYVLARSMLRIVAQSAQIAGYGAGGLLLAFLAPRGALAFDAASFAASALLLRIGLRHRPAVAVAASSMARDSLAGVRGVLAHRGIRRILLFSCLVPTCAVAPEALAAPYAAHIGQPARAAGFLLMGLPIGMVAADLIVARLLRPGLQRRLIGPAAVLVFAPLFAFAGSPPLLLAITLLVFSGLGMAWSPGLDMLMLDTAPPELRNRALALQGAALMFTQGAGFALWGLAGQFAPLVVVIPSAAVAGLVVVLVFRPRSRGPAG